MLVQDKVTDADRESSAGYVALRYSMAWLAPSGARCTQKPDTTGRIRLSVRALPAGITNRVSRFHRTPGAASMHYALGQLYLYGHGSGAYGHNGLDQCISMFAPCLLGCPGTGRQNTVLTSLRLAGSRCSSARHSIPALMSESNAAASPSVANIRACSIRRWSRHRTR
jgi:hypothetical protein